MTDDYLKRVASQQANTGFNQVYGSEFNQANLSGASQGLSCAAKRDQSITEILTEAQRNIHTALEIAKDIKVRVVAPKPQPVTAQGNGNATNDRNLNDDALALRATSHALLSALEAINGAL